ncbi:MAG: ChbG/HpnK family deacetylase, partial [Clostridia bacterium]|nr:ChbG/HpnK family deacetylase [Clostridia bacterium]
MIYFCADDYGISRSSNTRIEECLKKGVLNKISVLPNGDLSDFNERLLSENIKLSLHLNLVEGCPLSKKEDVSLLVTDKGFFKYSFIGLFFLSIFGNRNLFKKQIYNELKMQIDFWK